MYTPRVMAKALNGSVKTLQRWDRQGLLPAKWTPSNQRYYTEEDLAGILKLDPRKISRKAVVYCRVSSQNQRPDLANQKRILEEYCQEQKLEIHEWIMEIGGGLNFQRKHFFRLIDAIVADELHTLVIAHQDRLARFGFSLIEHLCEKHGCDLIMMNTDKLSPEQEMVNDLMTVVHCFSSRLYGLRNYRKALAKALKDDHPSPQNTSEPDA